MTRSFWTRRRINQLCFVLITSMAIAIPVVYSKPKPKDPFATIRLGDFPAFYTAAVILQAGQEKQLYDFKLQRDIQSRLCPGSGGEFMPFAYAPYVAALLSPLAKLPLKVAKRIFSCLMAFFLVVAIGCLANTVPQLKKQWPAVITFSLWFFPWTGSIIGAQNTAVSVLLYGAALWTLSWGNNKGDLLCGVCLGLWLFKPQYALPIILLFVFSKSWRILGGALGVGIIYYFIGSGVYGFLWPLDWVQKTRGFIQMHLTGDGPVVISILGTLQTIRVWMGDAGKSIVFLTTLIGCAAGLTLFLWLCLKFYYLRRIFKKSEQSMRLCNLFELAGPAVLLIAPTAGYYDIGICVVSCARHIKLETDGQINAFIVLVAGISIAMAYRNHFPLNPLFLVLLGVFLWLSRLPEND